MDHDLNVDSYNIDELFVVFKIDKTMDESTMILNINKMNYL